MKAFYILKAESIFCKKKVRKKEGKKGGREGGRKEKGKKKKKISQPEKGISEKLKANSRRNLN